MYGIITHFSFIKMIILCVLNLIRCRYKTINERNILDNWISQHFINGFFIISPLLNAQITQEKWKSQGHSGNKQTKNVNSEENIPSVTFYFFLFVV